MQDNGCSGYQPDSDALADLIDVAGAIAAAAQGLVGAMDAAAVAGVATDHEAAGRLLIVADDAREASWYLARAVSGLRALI